MSDGALTLQIEGSVIHAKFRGEIDLSNVDELREELTAVTPNDALGIVFDLSDVAYLDSAGLRMIQLLREELRVRGQGLQLVIPDDSLIRDVLRLAGLDWSDEIVLSVEAGRRSLDRDAS
jgi:anti-anti-sigma factor